MPKNEVPPPPAEEVTAPEVPESAPEVSESAPEVSESAPKVPESAPETSREVPAHVGALAIMAYHSLAGRIADHHDNEAEKLYDGTIRLSLRKREGGHERLLVQIPETITLQVLPYDR